MEEKKDLKDQEKEQKELQKQEQEKELIIPFDEYVDSLSPLHPIIHNQSLGFDYSSVYKFADGEGNLSYDSLCAIYSTRENIYEYKEEKVQKKKMKTLPLPSTFSSLPFPSFSSLSLPSSLPSLSIPSSLPSISLPSLSLTSSSSSSIKRCNCKKSQCLKLYCECFANDKYCLDCNCKGCLNLPHLSERKEAKEAILYRNPLAFHGKLDEKLNIKENKIIKVHQKGCSCKKSGCLKNYCECRNAGISCGEKCKCLGCGNCMYEKNSNRLIFYSV